MQLTNKKILITGGSSGLGFSLAKKLLEKDSFVYILGRHQESLEKAAKELSSNKVEIILADVSDYQQLQKSLENIEIDVLINNAGIWLEGTIDSNTDKEISDVIDINLKGA